MATPFPMRASEMLLPGQEDSCRTVEQYRSWEFMHHRHIDCCDLAYIHQGVMKQEVNGRRITLREGMGTLIRHGDEHRLWSRGVVMYNLNFREETLREAAAYLGVEELLEGYLNGPVPPVFETPVPERSALLIDYQTLLFAQRREGAGRHFRAFLIRWLLANLELAVQPRPRSLPPWLAELERFIEENVELPVRTADLARISGRSNEHIARCFRSYLGTTPSEAINAARLNRAALLLAHTNRSILDICYSLGYNSASYFYRLFGRRYGVSPRRYRVGNSVIVAPGTER